MSFYNFCQSETKQQIAQAKDYIVAGGTIEAIETKYKLTDEQRKDITKAKK